VTIVFGEILSAKMRLARHVHPGCTRISLTYPNASLALWVFSMLAMQPKKDASNANSVRKGNEPMQVVHIQKMLVANIVLPEHIPQHRLGWSAAVVHCARVVAGAKSLAAGIKATVYSAFLVDGATRLGPSPSPRANGAYAENFPIRQEVSGNVKSARQVFLKMTQPAFSVCHACRAHTKK
jgi:hypothetical protein